MKITMKKTFTRKDKSRQESVKRSKAVGNEHCPVCGLEPQLTFRSYSERDLAASPLLRFCGCNLISEE